MKKIGGATTYASLVNIVTDKLGEAPQKLVVTLTEPAK